MILTRRLAVLAAVAVAVVAVAGTAAQATPRMPGVAAAGPAYAPPSGVTDPCPPDAPGDAGCAALISAPATGTATPAGYSPANLQQAYGFQGARSGSGQTVAVATAYDDPDAASDLAAYRSQYGLTPCTAADGCFSQVSQTGSTTGLPGTAAGWTAPAAESIDMISAICPNCHILLVEASNSAISNLGTAENEAVTLGAHFVDNDWVLPEADAGPAETGYDTGYFDHPGVAITAPAGDDGYGTINYPAASQYVTAVGGTTLTADSGVARGYTEAAWNGTSSGCSAYEPKPSWQADAGCADRTLNDLAADADPSTPVAYYDTLAEHGWGEGSGTVVAAAIIAAGYALAGTPVPNTYPASYPYLHPGGPYTTPGSAYPYPDGLNNITAGSDGTCATSYLCTAGAGYNGPTGLGTPNTNLALTASGKQAGTFYGGVRGECMDDTGDVTTNGNKVQVWTCDGDKAQGWTAEPDGTLRIDGSYCMDDTNGGTANGNPVQLWTCLGNANQQWVPQANGELYNPKSGKCLDDPGASTTPGTQLDINACNGSAEEQWYVPYARPSATGVVVSHIKTAKMCVDDTNNATTNGNKIQVWTCNGNQAQTWAIEPDGTVQISGDCIATDNDGTSNGTKIVLWGCTGDPNQHWTERSDGTLVNTRSGTCLDDPSASTANGTQLQIWSCDGLVQQSWTLP